MGNGFVEAMRVRTEVRQTAPVHLRLLSRRRLNPHRRLRLTPSPPRPYVLHHRRVATLIAQGADLPIQHRQFSNPSAIRRSTYSVYGSSFEPRGGRGFGRIASGDFRYFRTVLRDTSSSRAIPRIERPAPFIS